MRRRQLLTNALLLCALAGSAESIANQDIEVIRPTAASRLSEREALVLNSSDGWVCASSDNSAETNRLTSTTRSGRNCLQWNLVRKKSVFNAIAKPCVMADFRCLDFDVLSESATTFVVPLEDEEGGKYHYSFTTEAGKWRHVHLTPADFKVSEDSPIKKSSIEASKLSNKFALADIGGVLGNEGLNVVQISGVSIERAVLPVVELPPVISGKTVEVLDDCLIKADVTVKSGALRIRSKRLQIAASIKLEDAGTLDISGSTVSFVNRYPHDITVSARKSSVVSIIRCNSVNSLPTNVDLWENSSLRISDTVFSGAGLTVGAPGTCSVSLSRTKNAGEFVFQPGSRMSFTGCENFLLWPWFMAPHKAILTLPLGNSIAWKLPSTTGINLSLQNCSGVMWGGIVDKGCSVAFKDTRLKALGVYLTGSNQKISGLKNKMPVSALKLPLSDRALSLNNCPVDVWNLYPARQGTVSVSNCLLGELIGFDDAKADIQNCVCDGTGGYVASKGQSKLTFSDCTFNSVVTSAGHSTMVLKRCRVNGDLLATGNSTIHLIGTSVSGRQKQIDGGIIIKDGPGR